MDESEEIETNMRERLRDEKFEEYLHVSELSFGIERIPEKLMNRAVKIFSKHTAKEVREWSSQLIKSYQLLHAVEKPMNLDYAQPFSSTSDLVNFTPHLDKNLAMKKELEREQEMKRVFEQASETEVRLDEE